MNAYRKYCPNVFVAQCEEKHEKGDVITITTKYGKENEHIIHNLVAEKNGLYFYSITRADGFNNQVRAQNKVDRLEGAAANAEKRSDQWHEKSNEGADFLRLAEPIKVGHHSEKRHRALIERNWNRMENSVKESEKAEEYRSRVSYWESMANKIDLSMPESIEYFEYQLEKAKAKHEGLKNGTIPREHSYSLTYAQKDVKDLTDKVKTAKILWE